MTLEEIIKQEIKEVTGEITEELYKVVVKEILNSLTITIKRCAQIQEWSSNMKPGWTITLNGNLHKVLEVGLSGARIKNLITQKILFISNSTRIGVVLKNDD